MNVKMMLNYICLQCYYFQLVILSKKIIIIFFRFLTKKHNFLNLKGSTHCHYVWSLLLIANILLFCDTAIIFKENIIEIKQPPRV